MCKKLSTKDFIINGQIKSGKDRIVIIRLAKHIVKRNCGFLAYLFLKRKMKEILIQDVIDSCNDYSYACNSQY